MRFTTQWLLDREARKLAKNRSPQEFEPTDDEGKLQDEIERECTNRGWVVFSSRRDKATTNKLGQPDVIAATHTGHVLFLELKKRGGKPTPAQRATLVWLRQNKQIAAVVRSKEEFLMIAETYLSDESLRRVEDLFCERET